MGQFNYMATWSEFWKMLSIIEEQEDFVYIPDLNYRTPKPMKVTSVTTDSYRKLIRKNYGAASIYMWSAEFSWDSVVVPAAGPRGYNVEEIQPLLLISSPGDFIEMSDGSPLWNPDLKATDPMPRGGVRKLNCGMLTYPDKYQKPPKPGQKEYPDPEGLWYKRSDDLRAAYQRVVSHMKKVLVHHRFTRSIWIGQEALQLVQAGQAQVIAHV